MWHNSDGKGHLTRSTKSMLRDKPRFEVAHILQKHHHQIPKLTANSWQARTLYAIAACRTSVLGGHVDKCSSKSCSHVHISYNSCRNRHCPKCQGNKRDLWIQAMEARKRERKVSFPGKDVIEGVSGKVYCRTA